MIAVRKRVMAKRGGWSRVIALGGLVFTGADPSGYTFAGTSTHGDEVRICLTLTEAREILDAIAPLIGRDT